MEDKELAAVPSPGNLERSSSANSTHQLSSAAPSQNRKGRSAGIESSRATSENASISSPPTGNWKTSIQQIQRRPSANGGYISLTGSDHLPSRPAPLLGDSSISVLPLARAQRNSFSDGDSATSSRWSVPDISRERLSATFSINSAIMSSSWGSVPSVASSNAGSDHGDDAVSRAYTSSRASTPAVALAELGAQTPAVDDGEHASANAQSPTSALLQSVSARTQSAPRPSRNQTSAARRMSGFLSGGSTTASHSPQSERSVDGEVFLGVLGICALDAKARSKPSRNILNRINSQNEFEVVMFGDKIILDEEPENWPLCDYLISFFSEGFPLHKAIEYVRLRKPFSVNDMAMQTVLWDRRACLKVLDRFEVPTPDRVEVVRDGGPRAETRDIGQHIEERTGVKLLIKGDITTTEEPQPKSVYMKDPDTLFVDGKELRKPFVEKPVNGDDHNIHIYYEGGGGRRLFRKINNKSSEADESLKVPRCITEEGSSYIYEKFLSTDDNEDVKAYTVGSYFCHAETRKSPVVDGIVKRNTHGKEVRYVAKLDEREQWIAQKIAEAFGQRVCGFDLLRASGKSYVIDVNGWSFVKDNESYYNKCAEILRDLFVKEKLRRDGQTPFVDGENGVNEISSRWSTPHLSSLKSILKSPSMSRIAGNHHLGSRKQRGDASPDISSQTIPMLSPPSQERASDVPSSLQNLPPSLISMGATSHTSYVGTGTPELLRTPAIPPPATKSQWRLKGMVAVIRHADRTPKQKFKYTFHSKPFVDLLKGHTEEVLLIGEAALNSVQEAVREALKEGIEDVAKLRQLKVALDKKGSLPGTKVQIKPMFRNKAKDKGKDKKSEDSMAVEQDDNFESAQTNVAKKHADSNHLNPQQPTKMRKESLTEVTLSRAAAAEGNLELEKLQLIVKWGGEPTHSARYQAQELGENFRNDLLLMNRDSLEDLKVFSSSERRVTTSAIIWTAAFLNVSDVPPNFITIRKDLLDDSNAAKDEMDKVKKKLKGLLRKGNKAPENFAWPENMPEPYLVARSVVELMQFHRRVMRENYARLQPPGPAAASLAAVSGKNTTPPLSSPVGPKEQNIQPRWCSGEDAGLFKERWEKLFDEFCDPEKVDPGKISELHDTIKFDALHNRQFLEWIFTPSSATFDEFYPGEAASKETVKAADVATSDQMKPPARSDTTTSLHRTSVSSASLSARMPWRKRASIVDTAALRTSANEPYTENYFNLYTGDRRSRASDEKLTKLRELFLYSKVLFDFIGPQEYGITDAEKLEIGLLTSLPLLRAIVNDIEDMQKSVGAKTRVYFTKESHIYTLLNCIIEGGITTKIDRKKIPELDYLSTICFELYESTNPACSPEESESFNYSIRIAISPGCHTFEPLDVQLDSKHCIGFAQRRSLTSHNDYASVIATLRARFHTVKLPKSFVAVNLSEKVPHAFGEGVGDDDSSDGAAADKVGRTTPAEDERGREEQRRPVAGET